MNNDNQKGIPGVELDPTKMPGHWLLARLGKPRSPTGRQRTHLTDVEWVEH